MSRKLGFNNAGGTNSNQPFLNYFKSSSSIYATFSAHGTATGCVTDGNVYAAGATVIGISAIGTGAISNGDVISIATGVGATSPNFNGFPNGAFYFQASTGNADISLGGSITLSTPLPYPIEARVVSACSNSPDTPGSVRITIASGNTYLNNIFDWTTNDTVKISGVNAGANGTWQITWINGGEFDLIGSVFTSTALGATPIAVICPRITVQTFLTDFLQANVGYADLLNWDVNGYPMSMTGGGISSAKTITKYEFFMFLHAGTIDTSGNEVAPFYPSGQWICLYDGTDGTLAYTGDATKNGGLSTPGRDVLDIPTPSPGGFTITLTGVGANYIKNIRLVPAAFESALAGGQVFTNEWINDFGNHFSSQRFLDMFSPFSRSENTSYAGLYTPAYRTYSVGTPFAVCVAMCNYHGANLYLNIPRNLTDAAVDSLALAIKNGITDNDGRVWAGLTSPHTFTPEYINETWQNNAGVTYPGIAQAGYVAFPSIVANDFNAWFTWSVLRAVQVGNIAKTAWGADGSRVVRVIAGQSVFFDRSNTQLSALATDQGGLSFTGTATIVGTTMTLSGVVGTPAKYQEIVGSGITASTYIQSGSGVTWTVNKSQTVGPVSVTGKYWTGTAASQVDALSVAPYFGGDFTESGLTLTQFFTQIESGGQVSFADGDYITTFTGGISGTTLTVSATTGSGFYPSVLYPGMPITSGAASGTTIVRQLTNAGSQTQGGRTGTYEVSISQSVSNGTAMLGRGGALSAQFGTMWGNKVLANFYGIRLISYEGGQGFVGGSSLFTFNLQAMADQRMYDVYIDYLNGWLTIVGSDERDIFHHYSSVGTPGGNFGFWGVKYNSLDPATPRWQALIDFIGDEVSGAAGTGVGSIANQYGVYRTLPRKIPHA